jgi:hypothetical protein
MVSYIPRKHLPHARFQFPIEKEVYYQCTHGGQVSASGQGKTLQMSSHEVDFTTESVLGQGEKVELAMEWPALLDNNCVLKLEICGVVVRSLPSATTVRIARYEFRTRGATLRVVHRGWGLPELL